MLDKTEELKPNSQQDSDKDPEENLESDLPSDDEDPEEGDPEEEEEDQDEDSEEGDRDIKPIELDENSTVVINGQEYKGNQLIPLPEYTRKTQEVAEHRKELEAQQEEFQQSLQMHKEELEFSRIADQYPLHAVKMVLERETEEARRRGYKFNLGLVDLDTGEEFDPGDLPQSEQTHDWRQSEDPELKRLQTQAQMYENEQVWQKNINDLSNISEYKGLVEPSIMKTAKERWLNGGITVVDALKMAAFDHKFTTNSNRAEPGKRKGKPPEPPPEKDEEGLDDIDKALIKARKRNQGK